MTMIQSHHQLQYALDFGLLKLMSLWCISKRTKVTCALTGRSPVRTAADDDFEHVTNLYKMLSRNKLRQIFY